MLELSKGDARYLINPYRGAATCGWKIGKEDIFYIEKKSYQKADIKFKGGNPVMFPNFSTLTLFGGHQLHYQGHLINLPQHGLARLSTQWRSNLNDSNRATLYLHSHLETQADFPFEFALEISYTLEERSLTLTQRVHNPGVRDLPFVMGFHPYFKVSNPKHCEITGLVPGTPCYALPNAGPFDYNAHLPRHLALGTEEINHHMVTGARTMTLDDRLTGRSIRIRRSEHYPCFTVWSEPNQPFVCMEPTSGRRGAFETRENLTRLKPGESWTGELTFDVLSI